jgi:hypothetical protein
MAFASLRPLTLDTRSISQSRTSFAARRGRPCPIEQDSPRGLRPSPNIPNFPSMLCSISQTLHRTQLVLAILKFLFDNSLICSSTRCSASLLPPARCIGTATNKNPSRLSGPRLSPACPPSCFSPRFSSSFSRR